MSQGNAAIADERLRRQRLTAGELRKPEDVVAWFGAVQAQEYEPAKWALALRMRNGVVAADIERAFNEGRILRTHVMRPTWHFVTASDIRWLLELTAPGVHRRMAPYNRQLELDARTLTRALRVIERALRDQRFLTRAELGEKLRQARLPMTSIHLAHVVMHAELERVVCSGPRRGKQFTYALLADRAPKAVRLPRDEALATLATRFFTSHGPATGRDFAWWSGLAAADAKRSLEIVKARRLEIDGRTYWTAGQPPRGKSRESLVHLLPIYDEYLVAYRDRVAVPHGPTAIAAGPRFVTFENSFVIAGQVAGTWRRVPSSRGVDVKVTGHRRLTPRERGAISAALERYETFTGTSVDFSIA
jgi:Winged helix DNA-binding domain